MLKSSNLVHTSCESIKTFLKNGGGVVYNPVRDLDLGLSLMRLASLDLSLAKSKSQINYSRLLVKQKKIQSIRLSLLLLFLNILLKYAHFAIYIKSFIKIFLLQWVH